MNWIDFETRPHRSISVLTVAMGLLVALVFYLLPNLDLGIARLFVDGNSRFFVADSTAGFLAREIAAAAPFVVLGGMVIAYVANRIGRPICRAPSLLSLIFLIASFSLSSGVVVNLGMKDHLHRPRPVQVTQFGGTRVFREYYQWDGTCPRNCSFPSGEASAAFWLVAPASLAPPPYRVAAISGALGFGLVTSLLRMAFGGHFLSDVLFASVITILMVVFFHWLFFRRLGLSGGEHGGPRQ